MNNRVSFHAKLTILFFSTALLFGLLFNSTANSQTWEQTNGPYGGDIKSLAINSSGDIFAGTRGGGVFRSIDNGDNWTESGLTDTYILAIAINSSDHIFAGTVNGVFRLLSTTDILVENNLEIIPSEYSITQNYPNPFNPTTTIEFSLPKHSSVSIDIYNILGQKIKTLVSTKLTAGSYNVNWDGANSDGVSVATGIYFYRLKADEFVKTRKMLLLK